ncbi:MAG: hypothetical protein ACYDBJ_22055 [Aggregatilineales bacterium]
MNDLALASELPNARHRFPYLLWPIWVVWLPLLIPPMMDLIRAKPGTLRLVVTQVGVALFVGIYLWATWRQPELLTAMKARKGRLRTCHPRSKRHSAGQCVRA